MAVTMIVWSVIIPFCLGAFVSMLFGNDALHISPVLAVGVIILLTSIPAAAVFLSAMFEDDRILISKEGIAFPLLMMSRLGLKRDRTWSELGRAEIALANGKANSNGLPDGRINLFFRHGGLVPLNLKLLKKDALEQFLLALEIWGLNCERSPALIEFQTSMQNSSRGLEQFSYTQMWEEELSRRFSATSFVPLEPNHKLRTDHLRIVRQLAFGGLSAIYLAQRNEKDLVVVKEAVVPANADEQSRAKAVELFEREAQLLIKLNHPNIAKVFDHFKEDGRNYLLLEYINGQDLRQLVKQHGPQPPELVLPWFRRLAEILDYLHNQRPPIVHRDLTPDNIVRREDNDLVLIDFGAANEFVGTATGTLVGKQAYIAPEQLRGKANVLSDIYALGGTAYFLLTGKDPEALSCSHPRDVASAVPIPLDELVARCTEMEDSDRPQSAKDVIELIDKIEFASSQKDLPSSQKDAAGEITAGVNSSNSQVSTSLANFKSGAAESIGKAGREDASAPDADSDRLVAGESKA
jgi:serine/threonine protein kinase